MNWRLIVNPKMRPSDEFEVVELGWSDRQETAGALLLRPNEIRALADKLGAELIRLKLDDDRPKTVDGALAALGAEVTHD